MEIIPRHQEMEFADCLNVVIWMDVRVCFPFTLLAIGLFSMVHFDNFPIIYYLNLLVANVIQLITLIFIVVTKIGQSLNFPCIIIYGSVAMVSLYFRVMIALERCFFITWPQLHFIRQTKHSVIISVLVWVLCLVIFPLLIYFGQTLVLLVFALIPSPVFIFCPIGTFIFLSRATSVSAEGKRRIVGTFLLLLVNYSVTIVPPVNTFAFHSFYDSYPLSPFIQFFLTLFLLSPFMDLFLLVFMREGPIDKLLSCLCCCKMETSAAEDGGRVSVSL